MSELNEEIVNELSETNDLNINKNKDINKKVKKRGIIYLTYIPFGLNVNKIRQLLSQFGEIDRIYLEREKSVNNKKKSFHRYIEGWVEFKKKKAAKMVAKTLNGTQIGGKRKNRFYDSIWSLKYLRKFEWSHLAEQLSYEKALRQQRLRLEISRAKTETTFYEQMTHKYNYNKNHENNESNGKRIYKQRVTEEVITRNKNSNNEIDFELLNKIFV